MKTFHVDPRTKLLLMLTITIFLSNSDDGILGILSKILTFIPFVFFLLEKKYKAFFEYLITYLLLMAGATLFVSIKNTFGMLLTVVCGISYKMMSCFIMGYFVINTTRINEFIVAMDKLHISNKVSISLSVVFRFFPTLAEEYTSINDAMKMRGIYLGGKHPSKVLEYRLIPFLMSSVKIGEELSSASLTRGLSIDHKRTNICTLKLNVLDLILIVFCIVSIVTLALVKGGII